MQVGPARDRPARRREWAEAWLVAQERRGSTGTPLLFSDADLRVSVS